jgi:hypothetical protein
MLLAGSASAQSSGTIKVSNPIEVPSNVQAAGVSAARCGSNIVVGFGDQESSTPNSFAGYSVSRNDGVSFSDGGVLPVSPADISAFGPDQLGANGPSSPTRFPGAFNPSVACVNSSLFYYATVYTDHINNAVANSCGIGPGCSAISVSTSNNGGVTWNLPVVVATESNDIHNLLFPTMSVDPSNLQRLYVVYLVDNFATPFDFPCGGETYELWLARSMDGGASWSNSLIDLACTAGIPGSGQIDEPSSVVSPDGRVYVAYRFIPQGPPDQVPNPINEIRFSRSLDHGQTFSAPAKVSALLGNAAPQLALDRTHSPYRGQIFLTWSGQPAGTHTDVLVADSLNEGASFSFPRPISPAPAAGTGRFQSNPQVAVDHDGQVSACFYSTPSNAPTNSSVYSYDCANSTNHGKTWQVQRIASAVPVGYNSLTVDFLTHHDGFFNAFEVEKNSTKSVVGKFTDIQ